MDILSSFTLPRVTPNLKYFQTQINIYFLCDFFLKWFMSLHWKSIVLRRKQNKKTNSNSLQTNFIVFLKPNISGLVKPQIMIQY